MEDMLKILQPRVNVSFFTFLKFYIPGVFVVFWVVLFVVRIIHSPSPDGSGLKPIIMSEAGLLHYLRENWPSLIGIILTFGGFMGIVLAGAERIVFAFMTSRILNFAVKYLLSSKKVDFAYYQFMRFHDLASWYNALPNTLLNKLSPPSLGLKRFQDGDFSQKYLFRETVQNYFWQNCIDKGTRSDLMAKWELGSAFIYMSFISLLLFTFQSVRYVMHIRADVGVETWLASLRTLLELNTRVLSDYVPLILAGYVFFTLIYNIAVRKRYSLNKHSAKELMLKVVRAKRKWLVITSLTSFFILCIFSISVLRKMFWISYIDMLLFSFFFLCFVAFYHAGTHEFSRYTIIFSHSFKQHEQQLLRFLTQNTGLLKEMDKELSRQTRATDEEEETSREEHILKSFVTIDRLIKETKICIDRLRESDPVRKSTRN